MAMACAFAASIVSPLGGGEADPAAPAGVLGAGTGLGVSGLISKNETAIALFGDAAGRGDLAAIDNPGAIGHRDHAV